MLVPEPVDARRAFAAEALVADRKNLIDEQNLGAEFGSDRETQSGGHARRERLGRFVAVRSQLGKVEDVGNVRAHLILGAPEQDAVVQDVVDE